MPVLQRLFNFKLVQDKQAIENSNLTNKNEISDQAKEVKKEIIHSNQKLHKKSRKSERINLECNDLNKNLAALIRRHNLRAWFSNSLYTYPISIKKDDLVRGYKNSVSNGQSSASTTTHSVSNKVLPISDTSTTSSTKRGKKISGDADQNKPKSISSKMKELVRWSASSKSHKQTGIKITHHRKGGSVNELVDESPKISLTLIQESCNTIGSDQCRPIHEKENWITTDDEFVVLEL